MAFRDQPGSGGDSDDARLGRYRARHGGAAPEAYPPSSSWRDGDGWDEEWPPRTPAAEPPGAWPPAEATGGWPPPEPASTYWPEPAADPDPPTAERPLVPIAAGRTTSAPPSAADPGEPARRTRAGRRRARQAGTPPEEPRTGRAGRNLPAAIGIAALLAGVVLGSLLIWRPAFLVVIVLAVAVGVWEMVRAVAPSGAHPPFAPLLAGGAIMIVLAWYGGPEALSLGLLLTVLATMVWRLGDGPAGYQRDTTMATLIAVYVPFLGGFAALLAVPPEDGHLRILVTLAAVVLSDTGGYAAGVFLGRRPMAPTISPKKSWEGFAGSLTATAVGSAVLLYYLLDIDPWWGAVYGLALSVAAVLGDLAESMLKRDLGIKDMSNLLPGHGGLMDRLDSILFALPTSYLLLSVLATTSG